MINNMNNFGMNPMGMNPLLMNNMNNIGMNIQPNFMDNTALNIKSIIQPYENKIRELEEIIKQKDFEIIVLKQKLNNIQNNNMNMMNMNMMNQPEMAFNNYNSDNEILINIKSNIISAVIVGPANGDSINSPILPSIVFSVCVIGVSITFRTIKSYPCYVL